MTEESNPKSLLRDKILAADDLTVEPVPVPEWGVTVRVRTMTGSDRDLWEQYLWAGNREAARRNVRSSLCAFTVIDESGALLFDEADLEALRTCLCRHTVPRSELRDLPPRLMSAIRGKADVPVHLAEHRFIARS